MVTVPIRQKWRAILHTPATHLQAKRRCEAGHVRRWGSSAKARRRLKVAQRPGLAGGVAAVHQCGAPSWAAVAGARRLDLCQCRPYLGHGVRRIDQCVESLLHPSAAQAREGRSGRSLPPPPPDLVLRDLVQPYDR
jgi:hypothetical protein